jgi:putative ABC transport system permease protein
MTALRSLRVAAFLSRRAITRGNRGIIVLTIAMMAIIYAELMFVPSLIQGATNEIQQELREYVTASIAITPSHSDPTIPNAAGLLHRVRTTRGVAAATATSIVGSEVSFGNHTNSWPVLAVDPASYARTFTTPKSMFEGTFLDPGVNDEIVLGIGIAGAGMTHASTYESSLQNVHVGDRVIVTLSGGRTHVFTVKGIYETDLTEANTNAFISTATADTWVPALRGRASAIYVRTKQIGDEKAVIRGLRGDGRHVVYRSWETLSSSVKEITGSFDTIKSVLNAVSLIVAAIAVFIVTYVDLVNKRRTIGIERAIGISGWAITLNYLLKAVVFTFFGVLCGAGLFFGAAIPLVRHHPFQFPIGPVTLSVSSNELRSDAVILLVVALLGALVPAWRAVRIRLIDAVWR